MLHRFWRYRLRTEKESVKYLLSLPLQGTTLLDIGANKGIYTYWMSKKAGSGGRVISFEPQPELGGFLNDVKASFGLDNVQIENVGLSDQAGTFSLIRGSAGSGGAMLESENKDLIHQIPGLHKVEVELRTLDEYFEGNDPKELSFIKIDVEGHEMSVFRGAVNTLKKHKPTILFECHHEAAKKGESFALLSELGYRGFFIHQNRQIDVREWDQYPYDRSDNHRNYIFVKD